AVKTWDGSNLVEEVSFKNILLWVHIHKNSWKVHSENNARRIAETYFPKLHKIDKSGLDNSKWSKTVKIWVDVTVEDPLHSRFSLRKVATKNTLKYKDVQDLCVYCGRIGHKVPACKERQSPHEPRVPRHPCQKFQVSVGRYSNCDPRHPCPITPRPTDIPQISDSPGSEGSSSGSSYFRSPTPTPPLVLTSIPNFVSTTQWIACNILLGKK
ncbi:hypothetical protein LINGRAHAP2_LOCUS19974, partial [Linum grandiflorum]